MNGSLQILIVDDHTLFRESVRRLLELETDLSVLGVCGNLDAAQKQLAAGCPDILLLDYDLGSELGTDRLAAWRRDYPCMKILMVTGGLSAQASHKAVRDGLDGLLMKHSNPQQLTTAIRQVATGDGWWDQAIVSALSDAKARSSAFTERQQTVLAMLLDGLSNKELAAKLDISETAVKASVQELFKKTGVRTRSQLVRYALESR